jgi:hypothetical protein
MRMRVVISPFKVALARIAEISEMPVVKSANAEDAPVTADDIVIPVDIAAVPVVTEDDAAERRMAVRRLATAVDCDDAAACTVMEVLRSAETATDDEISDANRAAPLLKFANTVEIAVGAADIVMAVDNTAPTVDNEDGEVARLIDVFRDADTVVTAAGVADIVIPVLTAADAKHPHETAAASVIDVLNAAATVVNA